jgi:hypothetical protein
VHLGLIRSNRDIVLMYGATVMEEVTSVKVSTGNRAEGLAASVRRGCSHSASNIGIFSEQGTEGDIDAGYKKGGVNGVGCTVCSLRNCILTYYFYCRI